jgi:predicted nucleic acid-binding protein
MGEMETTKTIIDTDILIDLLRNKKEAVAFVAALEEKKIELATTVINAFELHYGAHKSRQPQKNLQATKKLLSRLDVLPLTSKSAQMAGHIYAQLETKDQTIGLRDTIIAAIALTREQSVATRNTEHFKKITDLKIISPQEP